MTELIRIFPAKPVKVAKTRQDVFDEAVDFDDVIVIGFIGEELRFCGNVSVERSLYMIEMFKAKLLSQILDEEDYESE